MSITIEITCDGCGATRESASNDLMAGRLTSTGWYGWYGWRSTGWPVRHYCRACGDEMVARDVEDAAREAEASRSDDEQWHAEREWMDVLCEHGDHLDWRLYQGGGSTPESRAGWRKALMWGRWEVLLCHDIARISRDATDFSGVMVTECLPEPGEVARHMRALDAAAKAYDAAMEAARAVGGEHGDE